VIWHFFVNFEMDKEQVFKAGFTSSIPKFSRGDGERTPEFSVSKNCRGLNI
jgi:hypothetical protein